MMGYAASLQCIGRSTRKEGKLMGLYIPNEKMPPNCFGCVVGEHDGSCRLVVDDDGFALDVECDKVRADYYNRRADCCPLVNVPPHGDLISRTPLINRALCLRNKAKDDVTKRIIDNVIRYITEAPAVISVEEVTP